MTADAMNDNPAARVREAYERIHAERMADLPFLNSALEVEVLEFRPREGRWCGLLITPWFIGFVLMPRESDRWANLEAGTRWRWRLPSGRHEFMINHEPELGPYQTCNLFAPVQQFTDQEAARAAALEALERLYSPAEPPAPGSPEQPPRALSRRGFFRALVRR